MYSNTACNYKHTVRDCEAFVSGYPKLVIHGVNVKVVKLNVVYLGRCAEERI